MSTMITKDSRCNEYQRRIFTAMNFISEHAKDNLSLEDIARSAHFSKYHFHRLFKAFAGETVADFTRRTRLEKAANQLVLDANINITDLALEFGFSSAQNFTKQFTKQFGQPPSFFKHRKNHVESLAILRNNIKLQQPDEANLSDSQLNVQLINRPKFSLAYTRFLGPYHSDSTRAYMTQLQEILKAAQIEVTKPIGIAWDNPEITETTRCRYDIGVECPNTVTLPELLHIQSFPASTCAVYQCEITNGDLEKPWDDLITSWLPYSGYTLSGLPGFETFEKFDLDDPSSPWVIEICLPIVPMEN